MSQLYYYLRENIGGTLPDQKLRPPRPQRRSLRKARQERATVSRLAGKAGHRLGKGVLTLTINGVIPPQGSKSSVRRKNASIYLSKSCVCLCGSYELDRRPGSHLCRWTSSRASACC